MIGDVWKCTEDFVMDSPKGVVAFTAGKTYEEMSRNYFIDYRRDYIEIGLVDDQGYQHAMSLDDDMPLYFIKSSGGPELGPELKINKFPFTPEGTFNLIGDPVTKRHLKVWSDQQRLRHEAGKILSSIDLCKLAFGRQIKTWIGGSANHRYHVWTFSIGRVKMYAMVNNYSGIVIEYVRPIPDTIPMFRANLEDPALAPYIDLTMKVFDMLDAKLAELKGIQDA
ncbi:MAG: hypothetical protein JEZ11_13170 [Desulfobacterales bacterium]|nr:hypothetical protein [Desulfobacterales bacterium]